MDSGIMRTNAKMDTNAGYTRILAAHSYQAKVLHCEHNVTSEPHSGMYKLEFAVEVIACVIDLSAQKAKALFDTCILQVERLHT
jgi:hypothetical protein